MKASKKQRKGKLISAFSICNLLSYFIFSFVIDSAKGAESHRANIQQEPTYTRCQWALSNPQLESFNRVILQLSSILDMLSDRIAVTDIPLDPIELSDRITVTDTTLDSIEKIHGMITRWISGNHVFPVGDLLQIAYFLDIESAELLSTQNLQTKVHIDGLIQRSFMPDTVLQRRLISINRGLKDRIVDFTFQFSLQFENPDFNLSDLALMIGVSIEDLNQIKSSHFVPHYLQMEQILNTGNNSDIKVSVVDFFKEREESFGAEVTPLHHMLLQLDQVLESMNKVSIRQKIKRVIYDFILRLRNGQIHFRMETILQVAYLLNLRPSVFLNSNDWISMVVDIDQLVSRPFLSDTHLQQLLILINSYLKRKIENSNLTNEGPNTSIFISHRDFNNIMYFNKVPNYHSLSEILTQLNTSVEEFFQEIEETDEFRTIFDENSTEERSSYIRQPLTTEEKGTLKSMRKYLISIIDQNTSTPAPTIMRSLHFKRKKLSETHINFRTSSLIAIHYVMRYSISDIISKRQLTEEQLAQLPEIRLATDHRKEYIDKALSALMYLIKRQMQHMGLSIRSLSLRSGVLIATIYTFFQRRNSIFYLNLLKIVENGFEIPLEDFLAGDNVMRFSLEQLIEQFDSLNLDDLNIQVVDYLNDTDVNTQVYDNYVAHFKNRLPEILKAIDATSLGIFHIDYVLQLRHRTLSKATPLIRISTLLRIAHFFNIDLATLLLHHENLSFLRAMNTERLPDELIQNSLNILSQNIQNEIDTRHLTLRDLHLRSGANRLSELEAILNGQMTVTYSQLITICKALLQQDEDPFVLLQHLLNGVSTL